MFVRYRPEVPVTSTRPASSSVRRDRWTVDSDTRAMRESVATDWHDSEPSRFAASAIASRTSRSLPLTSALSHTHVVAWTLMP